jgi:hypothetical protein
VTDTVAPALRVVSVVVEDDPRASGRNERGGEGSRAIVAVVRCCLTGRRVLTEVAEPENRDAVLDGERVGVELAIGIQSELGPEFEG